jgi:hypothetical protein
MPQHHAKGPLRAVAAVLAAMGVLAAGSLAAPASRRITVAAGKHDRRDTLVSFPLEGARSEVLTLRGPQGGAVPLQVDGNGIAWFVLDELPAGQSRAYAVEPGAAGAAAPMAAAQDGDIVKMTRAGRPLLEYRGGPGVLPAGEVKPVFQRGGYLHPVQTPSGAVVTDDYPPNHLHHHGVWFAWTKTEFAGRAPDFWNMGDGKAKVAFEAFDASWSGPVQAGVRARHRYLDQSGASPVAALKETWETRAYALGGGARPVHVFDVELTQTTVDGVPLVLPEYHYGGIGMRGRREWDGKDNASFLTSEGKDRSNGHATRGRWADLYGRVEGGQAGLAVLDHPGNFRSPQPMRIHPTEPFFCYAPSQLGRWEITPGTRYVSRYRFVVHDGPPDPKELDRLWNDYADPPQVTLSAP